jgi:GT2 family glycosyltransferase
VKPSYDRGCFYATMTEPLLISVILNTNRREDTLACLASLDASHYGNHKALVLDNASSDGSVAAIREAFPEVEVLSLETNLGYAGNNNAGIAAAVEQGAGWIFVLNEDTIVDPDCLTYLVAAGERNEKIGIVGPDGLPLRRAGDHPIGRRDVGPLLGLPSPA